MDFTVTGLTVETRGMTKGQLEQAKIFSGKNAGICYMGESYFDSEVTDPDKALKRFKSAVGRTHHSIADHVRVEVLLEGVSKMLAIVLNSLQDYATSEKSGRYTVMTGNSELECNLYKKWLHIFKKRVLEIEPDIDDDALMNLMKKAGHDDVIIENGDLSNGNMSDDDECHQEVLAQCKKNESLPSTKVAQENARYVLSVFTKSTTLGYSTSIRQWNYIYDWCQKYMKQFEFHDEGAKSVLWNVAFDEEASYFERELYKEFLSLSEFIKETIYIEEIRDTKNRCFEFLTYLSGQRTPMSQYHVVEADALGNRAEDVYSEDDHLGITYNVSYPASFVHIAQAERHRTLKYFMLFNPLCSELEFFVPKCIEGTSLEEDWLDDLKSVSDIIPQATMVGIIETGHISDFTLKCKERLCGRAQWEIMTQTRKTAERFIKGVTDGTITSPVCKEYIAQFTTVKGECATKCSMCGDCKEPCRYGANKALDRKI